VKSNLLFKEAQLTDQPQAMPAGLELVQGKWIDGLVMGEFDNGWQQFEITAEDLAEIAANTKSNLEATKDSEGNVVGFAIDSNGHNHGEAAGWIVDVRIEDGVLQLLPKWTALGVEQISESKTRYFSAEIDLKANVLLGGSLTNWPATRDEEEKILLRPVELSENKFLSTIKTWIDGLSGRFDKIELALPAKGEQSMKTKLDLATLTTEDLAELGLMALEKQMGVQLDSKLDPAARLEAGIAQLAESRVTTMLKAAERKKEIATLSAKLTEGESGAGLPLTRERMENFLSRITDEELLKEATAIFEAIVEKGLVAFSTNGSGAELEGKTPLPERYALMLDKGELTLTDLENPALALGDLMNYDLSKWTEKEK